MDEWYEELDFEENPFSTNPSDFVKNIVGRDEIIDDLTYRVKAGSLVFIEGAEGSGKSSLLRLLIRKFKGRGRVIYVNCEKFENELNIEDLLVQRNGLIKGMLMKQKPKNMILFLDNVTKLSFKNMERIKYYFDENFLKTVVFTGDDFEKTGFSKSLVQRIEGRVIKLPALETYQIVDMVRERIGDIKFLSDEIIELVAENSENNPKKVLKNLEEVSEYAIGIDEEAVTEKHVREVLGLKEEAKEVTQEDVEEATEPIPEVEIIPADEDEDADDIKKVEADEEVEVEPASEEIEPEVSAEKPSKKKSSKKKEAAKEAEDESSDDSESVENNADGEDVLSKPIVSDDDDDDDKKKVTDEDDDFFADDFFDDDVEEESKDDLDDESEEKKKSKDDDFDDYDDFFDDDFEK